MKKLYFLLIVVLSFTTGNTQIINFPDANFKARLLIPGCAKDGYGNVVVIDANNDGEKEVSEVQTIFELGVTSSNISDLTGISYFTNLKFLNCSNNLLQTIVIDPSVTMWVLVANHNSLTSIDVHFDQSIDDNTVGIDLSYNNLTSFTVDPLIVYDYVYLDHNQLNNLTLGGSIDALGLDYNNLTTIYGNAHLNSVSFSNNLFTLLDLSNIHFGYESSIYLGNNISDKVHFGPYCPGIVNYSSNNTSFDLGNFSPNSGCESGIVGGVYITNSPNLNFLSLKNGVIEKDVTCNDSSSGETWTVSTLTLTITNCPSLSFICVDEGEQEHIQAKINTLGLQNQVQVNSYCSFVPGDTFYTINGITKFDENNNGCDTNDVIIPNYKFAITNGTTSGTVISNATGSFTIPVQPGTHTISPSIENTPYFNVSPSTISVTFPADVSPFVQNFCITPNGIHNDLEVSIIPINNARPGFNSTYKIIYKNKGTHSLSGIISFLYNDAILDFVSSNPSVSSQINSILNWDFTNLAPFESREITVTMNVNSPIETPPVFGGDILNFTISINSSLSDETPNDNIFTLNQTVVNSFDPNDKTCLEGNTITPEMIGKEVHYMIRFENTGTANAENIVVKDMIDIDKFDINSLIPLASSHTFVTRINETNKVEFIFENINLPFDDANNDGYVTFKIKTKPTLVLGSTFSNTASIYFDYNFPIVTDPATTTVALLANSDFDFENYFKIYPNPTYNTLNIETKTAIDVKSLNIYNTLGQLVLVITNAQKTKSVDVSSLETGNYFIKINTDKGSSNSRFIKM